MNGIHPHTPRRIRFLELWEHEGWRMKLYGICENDDVPHREYVEMGKSIASRLLPRESDTPDRHGLGFVVIHEATMFNQIVVDWWERSNELRHHVFKAETRHPLHFENITATGEAFCVWELRVIGFERDAWVDTMLDNPDGMDVMAYLGRRLNEDS